MSYYPGVQEVKCSISIIDRQRSEIEKRKPYKFPKHYISYQTFLELVVMSQLAKDVYQEFNRTTAIYYLQSSLWDLEHIPIYGLSTETLALFQESNIDSNKDLFENLSQSQSTKYCVLLPSGNLVTNDDNYIEVLWIESIRNNDSKPKIIEYKFANELLHVNLKANSQRIVVTGMDTAEQTYCVFSDYPTLERKISNINEDGDLDDRDRQIIGNLSHLALQIVMSIEFLPEAIVLDAKPSESISKGFGKKSPSGNYWQIRQISIEQKRYVLRQKSGDDDGESTRNSPRPHWRKWHWRRVAIGPERKGREWRLIPNTYINPDS